MNAVEVMEISAPTLAPLDARVGLIPVANRPIREWLMERAAVPGAEVRVRADFWPSRALIAHVGGLDGNVLVLGADGAELLRKVVHATSACEQMPPDPESLRIVYPWDILAVNERLVRELDDSTREGLVRPGATVDGTLALGAGSVVLPGVYIEGHVIIGRNCKIGPNCYLRGNTSIGDDCHIGQAVEIKNSLLMDHVSVGHLSYVGDSVIASRVNFGAGTICSNLRHDGRNHLSPVDGVMIDTGRRKFGVIVGGNVHTGIHTGCYPGRKLWPNVSTLPGEIVRQDKQQ